MNCNNCGSEVEPRRELNLRITGKFTDVAGDTITGKGEVEVKTLVACDCREVEAGVTRHKLSAVPSEWIEGEDVDTPL